VCGNAGATWREAEQSFFASFFSKKEDSYLIFLNEMSRCASASQSANRAHFKLPHNVSRGAACKMGLASWHSRSR
jgi:hypothetical protein